MDYFLGAVALVLLVIIIAMIRQYLTYLSIRRNRLHDRQPPLYSKDSFHLTVWLTGRPGGDIITALQDAKAKLNIEAHGGQWIYAGKAIHSGLQSSQLGEEDWSAVLLLQYQNRAACEAHTKSDDFKSAFAPFDRVYTHGLRRNAFVNLMLHQGFLIMKLNQFLTRKKLPYPFEPAPMEDLRPDYNELRSKLLAESELGKDAIMIFNLIKPGNKEQRAADTQYGLRMFALMAKLSYGPMHLGRAEAVEGSAKFSQVAIVYYPGVRFFADMAGSTFFRSIIGDKQLGDTVAVITVPVLDHL